jgi:hypothetical protein
MISTNRSSPISARSPTGLMSLGTRLGDVLRIEADGADAAPAVDRIVALVRDGFGELAVRGRLGSEDPPATNSALQVESAQSG